MLGVKSLSIVRHLPSSKILTACRRYVRCAAPRATGIVPAGFNGVHRLVRHTNRSANSPRDQPRSPRKTLTVFSPYLRQAIHRPEVAPKGARHPEDARIPAGPRHPAQDPTRNMARSATVGNARAPVDAPVHPSAVRRLISRTSRRMQHRHCTPRSAAQRQGERLRAQTERDKRGHQGARLGPAGCRGHRGVRVLYSSDPPDGHETISKRAM